MGRCVPLIALERFAPDQRAVVPERFARRGDRRGVRLMLQLGYDELHGASSCASCAGARRIILKARAGAALTPYPEGRPP